jgi:hypothetical protein
MPTTAGGRARARRARGPTKTQRSARVRVTGRARRPAGLQPEGLPLARSLLGSHSARAGTTANVPCQWPRRAPRKARDRQVPRLDLAEAPPGYLQRLRQLELIIV